MAGIPISWQLQIQGAEEVKSKLQQVTDQFNKGQISTADYAKGLRDTYREARTLNNENRISTEVFLAMHPALNNLTRAMSVMSSVERAAISGITAINTAGLLFNQSSEAIAQAEADLAQAKRDLAKDIPGSDKWLEDMDKIRIANSKLKEATEQNNQAIMSSWISMIGTVSLVVGTAITSIPKLIPLLEKLGSLSIGGGLTGLFSMFSGAATGIAASIPLFHIIDDWLKSWNDGYKKWADFRDNTLGPGINGFFTNTIPNAMIQFANFIGNFFKKTLPLAFQGGIEQFKQFQNGVIAIVNMFGSAITTGVNSAIMALQSLVNAAIGIYNKLAPTLHLPTLSPVNLPQMTYTPIKAIGDTNSSSGNSSTASAQGLIYPWMGNSSGSGTTIVNNFNTAGSIISENDLMKTIDNYFKSNLRGVGYSQ